MIHNFQTLEWARLKKSYGNELVLMKVYRRMRHSSKRITGEHYIKSLDALNINKFIRMDMGEILKQKMQVKLFDYF